MSGAGADIRARTGTMSRRESSPRVQRMSVPLARRRTDTAHQRGGAESGERARRRVGRSGAFGAQRRRHGWGKARAERRRRKKNERAGRADEEVFARGFTAGHRALLAGLLLLRGGDGEADAAHLVWRKGPLGSAQQRHGLRVGREHAAPGEYLHKIPLAPGGEEPRGEREKEGRPTEHEWGKEDGRRGLKLKLARSGHTLDVDQAGAVAALRG